MPASARRRHRLATFLAVAAALLVLSVLFGPIQPPRPRLANVAAVGAMHQARILRDTWGVPHIFGKTDADTAYGLAWAHAEDDFPTIQRQLLAARGQLASVFGREAAANDYIVALLRVRETVEARYETDLSTETRALVEAYADGINRYVATHPKDALPGLYPVSGQDVIAGFVASVPLFFDLDKTLRELIGPSALRPVSRKGETTTAAEPRAEAVERGSNGIAVAPRRSADGFTRLAVNSHQPWQGPLAWYEAHVQSEEGWDAVGGLMPGAPLILQGHNRDLGWTLTVNRPDLIDVYVLSTNPRNPNQYRFDGEWRDLEVRQVPIVVKLWGHFQWTFVREALWSLYGPIVRTPHGTYAIRYAAMGDVRAVEQWYRMNKARTRDEWQAAMRITGIPMFNMVYADREGHIGYFYNARLPRRAEGYDWSQYLPGDTKRDAVDRDPPLRRAPAGAGSSVRLRGEQQQHALSGHGRRGQPRPRSLVHERRASRPTSRTVRCGPSSCFGQDNAITRDAFDRYKFDTAYSARSATALRLNDAARRRPAPRSPRAGRPWTCCGAGASGPTPGSPAAALALLTLRPKRRQPARRRSRRTSSCCGSRSRPTGSRRVRPPRRALRRGPSACGGARPTCPSAAAPTRCDAVYARGPTDGRFVATGGDSYILMVEWDREGRVHSRSINPYGSATLDAASRRTTPTRRRCSRGAS